MSTITVELGERAYPIIIESNALCNAQALQQAIKGKTVLIVSNTTVAPLYAERMAQLVRDLGKTVYVHELPDGEAYKNLETLNSIFDALLSQQ